MDPGYLNIDVLNFDLTYTFAYYCEEDIRIRNHTNKRGREQNTDTSFKVVFFLFSEKRKKTTQPNHWTKRFA